LAGPITAATAINLRGQMLKRGHYPAKKKIIVRNSMPTNVILWVRTYLRIIKLIGRFPVFILGRTQRRKSAERVPQIPFLLKVEI
jgi:hypothetical protein